MHLYSYLFTITFTAIVSGHPWKTVSPSSPTTTPTCQITGCVTLTPCSTKTVTKSFTTTETSVRTLTTTCTVMKTTTIRPTCSPTTVTVTATPTCYHKGACAESGSHCHNHLNSLNCREIQVCGNGKVEQGEECDLGDANGLPGSPCSLNCTRVILRCGDGVLQDPEECDDGLLNGTPQSNCTKDCRLKRPVPLCKTCDPTPGRNKCKTSTSCIVTPSGRNYCACRAGYRADGLAANDSKQFRLNFQGQAYRVFVTPGIECNTLCDHWELGPNSCREVPVKSC
jgi:cysteine-rich repeat protein